MPLPRTVKVLGVVSLLNDASSEMIYPLLPTFLTTTLKAGPAFLGLVEGAAEATASLLKIASGWLSDRLPRRKPLVVGGYVLASLARPVVAVAVAPWHVLLVRLADRIGKGMRSAPRDALLCEATPPGVLGRAYGFHRAMDHAGGLIGPLLASAILWMGSDLRTLFAVAAVPAAAAVLVLVWGVRETRRPVAEPQPTPAVTTLAVNATGGRPLRGFFVALAIFTLGNSSDAFLLLRAQEVGLSVPALPLLWAAHHLVKSVASTHGGALSDRLGRRAAIVAGWALYALSYAGLAVSSRPVHVCLLFAVYGLFHALTEGPERALVADLSTGETRGRVFGFYHAVTGGMLLPASLLTGALWQRFGAATSLLTGAGLAAVAVVALLALVQEPRRAPQGARTNERD